MYSAFFGLNVGAQGLFSAKTALNVTNHNIANIETQGYSRQYHVQKANRALMNGMTGMIGTGSGVIDIRQHRDFYLDEKYWKTSGNVGEYTVKEELMGQLELIFNEPTDDGLHSFHNNIFKELDSLSKNPSDRTCLKSFVNSIDTFSNYLNDMGNKLLSVQKDANYGITVLVDTINHHAKQIALLNHQITNIEVHGTTANDLRDERARLVDELSEVVNIDVREYADSNGKKFFKVTIDGQILVDGKEHNSLFTKPRALENNPEDGLQMLDIYLNNGKELYLDSEYLTGKLKGYIDIRDGNNEFNYRGNVVSGAGTTTLIMDGVNRTDINQTGELNVGGKVMSYHSASYDPATSQMTLEFGFTPAMNGVSITTQDIYGHDFNGVVNFVSPSTITIANPTDQSLRPTGNLNIGGTQVTYTSYSKDPITHEITLEVEVPASATGNTAYQGDNMAYKGVPYYIQQMNEYVRTFAKAFNDINMSGRGGVGEPLFVYDGYTGTPPLSDKLSYDAINIHNLRINEAVLNDITLVENTSNPQDPDSDNELILDMIALRHDKTLFNKGESENYLESVIGEIGINSKNSSELLNGQDNILRMIDNKRLSISGVEINEEAMSLVKYQQAYNLAAKIISTMDEIYDVTINRMGL